MDMFVLLGSFLAFMLIGMPVAYALGLASLVGALGRGCRLKPIQVLL